VSGAFACEAAWHRRVEAEGLGLHLLEWGRPRLLLLHDGAAHAHWFDAVGPDLADGESDRAMSGGLP
jgi:hypothetical protein